jgi:hypothetical protein
MNLAKIALLLVVLVDIMGQGLLYPILTTLMLDPTSRSCRRARRNPTAASITAR